MTGAVLIASFISFAIGGTLPIVGERGNMRIFNLPVPEQLQAVGVNAAAAVHWEADRLNFGSRACLATAYRHAVAENVVMQAAAALSTPDGPAAELLGDLLGLAAPVVLSPAQLRVFELAGADPACDGSAEPTE